MSSEIMSASSKSKAVGKIETHNSATEVSIKRLAPKPPRKGTKVHLVMIMLSVRSFNRFEAEQILHEHCLHSTVSTIQKYGIRVDRKTEMVKGFMGNPTKVCRYWIDKTEAKKARKFLRGV